VTGIGQVRRSVGRITLAIALQVLTFAGQAAQAAQDPEAVARALYAAFDRGDSQAVGALLAPDVLWTFLGPPNEIPYAGVYRGPQGVSRFFQLVADTVRVEKPMQMTFVTQGDTVLVRGIEKGTAVATDGRYAANWLHTITVHEGRITRFEELTDSAAIVDALAPADSARGRAYFTTCAGCHAPQAQGNRDMNAPNLTGIDARYLVGQLRHFVAGVRGGSTSFYGWQMNGRAAALPGDRAIRDVAAYVSTLAPQRPAASITGDWARGQSLFSACAACHGEQGQGDSARGAPALTPLDDWYQERQLRDFRSGARGGNPADVPGQLMRAAAAALPDDRAIADVIAYVNRMKTMSQTDKP
jgi:cytochrome c553